MGYSPTDRNGELATASDVERLMEYCPDLENWPKSWSAEPRDIAPGQRIVEFFTPFLLHLLSLGLSRKTQHMHRDNLWALGGEIIRDLNMYPSLREKTVVNVLLNSIDEEGGPLLYHATSEQEQGSFDSTCRRFHRFLQNRTNQAG